MKKMICLMLVLTMALSLAACGGNEVVSGQVSPNEGSSTNVPGGIVEELEPTETEPSSDRDLSLGRMEGGVYTNEYAGFTCTLDANWSFLSAVELQQVPASVSEAISGSELAEALEGSQQFMDMQAENVAELTSINVLYQKLSMQERLAYAAATKEQVLEGILSQQDSLTEAYAQAGIIVSSMKVVKVDFLGQERYAMHTEATIQDTPYFILQLFDFNLGAYSVTTTVASFVEDNTTALLGLFSPLEQ